MSTKKDKFRFIEIIYIIIFYLQSRFYDWSYFSLNFIYNVINKLGYIPELTCFPFNKWNEKQFRIFKNLFLNSRGISERLEINYVKKGII